MPIRLAGNSDGSPVFNRLCRLDYAEKPVTNRRSEENPSQPDRQDSFFLVHLEHQAQTQSDFARRMFRYFARLHEKHGLPVYPIALFSHDSPRLEPNLYEVAFPDQDVLRFQYRTIQLSRYSWRDYVRRENPAACALLRVWLPCPMSATTRANPAVRLIARSVPAARSQRASRSSGPPSARASMESPPVTRRTREMSEVASRR